MAAEGPRACSSRAASTQRPAKAPAAEVERRRRATEASCVGPLTRLANPPSEPAAAHPVDRVREAAALVPPDLLRHARRARPARGQVDRLVARLEVLEQGMPNRPACADEVEAVRNLRGGAGTTGQTPGLPRPRRRPRGRQPQPPRRTCGGGRAVAPPRSGLRDLRAERRLRRRENTHRLDGAIMNGTIVQGQDQPRGAGRAATSRSPPRSGVRSPKARRSPESGCRPRVTSRRSSRSTATPSCERCGNCATRGCSTSAAAAACTRDRDASPERRPPPRAWRAGHARPPPRLPARGADRTDRRVGLRRP